MNPNQVLVKTDKGREEIKTRSLTLSQHARNLLIATDGQRSCGELAQLYSKIPDVAAVLQELVDQGLAEGAEGTNLSATPSSNGLNGASLHKLKQATQYLNETANANLGFGGFTFTLKVGRCNTLEDIRALIPDYQTAVTKKRGAETANALIAKLNDIIK